MFPRVNGEYSAFSMTQSVHFFRKTCETERREPCTVVTNHDGAVGLRKLRRCVVYAKRELGRRHSDFHGLSEVGCRRYGGKLWVDDPMALRSSR